MTRFAKFFFSFALTYLLDWSLALVQSEFHQSAGASTSSTNPDFSLETTAVDSLHRRAKKSSKSSKTDSSLSESSTSKKSNRSGDAWDLFMAPTSAPVTRGDTSWPTFAGDLTFFLDQLDDNGASLEETNSKKAKRKSSKTSTSSGGSTEKGKSKTHKSETKQSKKSQDEDVGEKSEKKNARQN